VITGLGEPKRNPGPNAPSGTRNNGDGLSSTHCSYLSALEQVFNLEAFCLNTLPLNLLPFAQQQLSYPRLLSLRRTQSLWMLPNRPHAPIRYFLSSVVLYDAQLVNSRGTGVDAPNCAKQPEDDENYYQEAKNAAETAAAIAIVAVVASPAAK
jgi:hypothetical protein